MGQDIFGRNIEYKDTYDPLKTGASKLTISGLQAEGYLIQDVSVNYGQALQRLYELGSTFVYFVAGRPEGDASFGKLAAPGDAVTAFIKKFGDPCANETMEISATNEWCGVDIGPNQPAGFKYTITKYIITNVGVTVNSRDMLVAENVKGMCGKVSGSTGG